MVRFGMAGVHRLDDYLLAYGEQASTLVISSAVLFHIAANERPDLARRTRVFDFT